MRGVTPLSARSGTAGGRLPPGRAAPTQRGDAGGPAMPPRRRGESDEHRGKRQSRSRSRRKGGSSAV
eukprot:777294-Pyramimonas_sp.AAC.1